MPSMIDGNLLIEKIISIYIYKFEKKIEIGMFSPKHQGLGVLPVLSKFSSIEIGMFSD